MDGAAGGGAADRRTRHTGAGLRAGADGLRSPVHVLHYSLRAGELAQRAVGYDRGAGWAVGRPGLQRGGAHGANLTSWGADLEGAPRLGKLVAATLRAVPELARLRLSSIDQVEADPQLVEAIAGERPADAAPAPVAAGGRRHDPEADEAAAPPRRRRGLLPRDSGRTARHRVRRGYHCRISRPRPKRCSRTHCGWSRSAN